MLGWFKKKFGKKEEQIPAPDQEHLDQTEPDQAEPSLTGDISLEPPPLILEDTQEPPASIEPLPQTSSFSDLPKKEASPGKKSSSMFQRLSERLTKTKESLVYRIDTLFLGKKEIDKELLDDLEEILITADLGINTVQELLDEARRKLKRKELSDPQTLKKVLKEKIRSFITESDRPAELVMPDKGPFIIMVVGVNGVGKTTTIGKITHKFTNAGQSVLLVAADTFRAAAVAQLKIWGERNNVQVVSQHEGADPSSVVYDAMDIALAKNYDVVIVDTAGRLHTQVNLMEELKKIKRVIGKKIADAPHEVMLILDATTGQNAISQAKLFNATVDITGLTLTKLDGTAKGGIVVNICRELKIPIRFIGIGEQLEDLRDFDPNEFVEALFQEKEGR
ncbi:MAG: signal recognition particle-docking protein FtsY [Proteobacteria bacterium]|jgi:fused signal recognition particle receptor|nr:signal recognition particle-docking protein FtsY [Desulfocapsa sp.]MBU3944124.1 signal recognition particle-docking protein FtsY [Pseudomonadota bacterium]MCG2743947.1 signal recognition particle-docking protein FtsY [Desulfobacteraceae bacterium]MBU3983405.1 signal recognition particle-docking protein FtsY [Pseudomonadota bacterium]MBU4029735.1 signal recognition particle-docking protein FtsY [Pseudomonadota bacterium]